MQVLGAGFWVGSSSWFPNPESEPNQPGIRTPNPEPNANPAPRTQNPEPEALASSTLIRCSPSLAPSSRFSARSSTCPGAIRSRSSPTSRAPTATSSPTAWAASRCSSSTIRSTSSDILVTHNTQLHEGPRPAAREAAARRRAADQRRRDAPAAAPADAAGVSSRSHRRLRRRRWSRYADRLRSALARRRDARHRAAR